MTDGCCVQCGAERVPLLRQRLPRKTAARRDLRGNRDHPPRQTGTPEQHLVALAHVAGRYGHHGVVHRGGNSADAIGTLRAALRAGQFSMAGRMVTFCAGGSGKRVVPQLLFVTMRPCKPE